MESCLEMHRRTKSEEQQLTFQFIKMAILVRPTQTGAPVPLMSVHACSAWVGYGPKS